MWTLSFDGFDGANRMITTDAAQDLLVVAETPPDRQWDVRFYFLSLERSGQQHPNGAPPITRQLPRSMQGEVRYALFVFYMMICGHHVAWCLVRPHGMTDHLRFDLEVWNWRTGRLVWAREFDSLVIFTFLDPSHIALVGKAYQAPKTLQIHNIVTTDNHMIHIPTMTADPTLVCSMQLPPVLGLRPPSVFCDKLTCKTHTSTMDSIFESDPASALLTLRFHVDATPFILVVPVWELRREVKKAQALPAYRRRRDLLWSDWGTRCGIILPLGDHVHDVEAFGPRLALLPKWREGNPDSGRIVLLDFSRSNDQVQYASPVAAELLRSIRFERSIWTSYFSEETMRSTLPYFVTVGPDVSLPREDGEQGARMASRILMQPDGFTLEVREFGRCYHLRERLIKLTCVA
ncbi:hypothetical protein ONZ51_g2313 [Trametes cubensis]|uniref:Uncharacterized protein n=1 Tax=Trametes cubensis TaxID=1111947 RepID=A0AAD7U0I1_9APHY|nr:hypothetical protein ONZ51_g2313 [Trametes cubensis]